MEKVVFVEGYNDNQEAKQLNELLAQGEWRVKHMFGVPRDTVYPVFAFVLSDEID